MRRIHWLVMTSLLAAAPFLGIACSGAPEAAGDECETDGDPCPSGMTCAPGGEDGETICQIEPGGSCDREAEDPFCLGDARCAQQEGGSICVIPPGGDCDPAAEDPFCEEPTICREDGEGNAYCGLPPGSECDPNVEKQCAPGLLCEAEGEDPAICQVPEGGECDPAADDPYCVGDYVCAELASGGYACFAPVQVRGQVFDATDDAAIEGAHVIALDDQATAVTDVAISAADGSYSLNLPVARDENGAPIDTIFTLRSQAQDYQTFPSGLRTALPIQTTLATEEPAEGDRKTYVIDVALTDIALLPLPADEQGRPSISGAVLADDRSAGVLVVAENGEGVGLSTISDKAGAYTIFNVPPDGYTVKGYAAGVVLDPVDATVADASLTGIDLTAVDVATGDISGSVQIVNAPGGSLTSVILVVESTFDDTFVRGEVPRGLRTPLSGPPDVSGGFTIADVPPGRYVVLAAFENDALVRDPDPNIAGTQIVTIEMPDPGNDISLDDSFKITEALEVLSPGADEPEAVSGTPTFQWVDDSSEEFYSVVVYNAFGDLVWEDQNVPGVSGGNVSVQYGGPALEAGMYYQFRATSWRQSGNQPPGPISTTEDLRGVFYAE